MINRDVDEWFIEMPPVLPHRTPHPGNFMGIYFQICLGRALLDISCSPLLTPDLLEIFGVSLNLCGASL